MSFIRTIGSSKNAQNKELNKINGFSKKKCFFKNLE